MAKENERQADVKKGTPAPSIFKGVPFDLSSFQLENCAFEIRYPFALALWDKSGQVWKSIQDRWPEITPLHAEPTKTGFQLGKGRLQIEFEQARITSVDPDKSLDQFSKDAKEFIRLTIQNLQISLCKRVGFRLIYFKEFKDKTEASEAFFSLGLIRVPVGKKFEIDERPINPQYGLRWESAKKGLMLNCRAETRTVDVDPPPEAARFMQLIHKETSGIVFDIDYYTVAPVESGQLDAGEWIKHALHLMSRDSKYVFEA